MKNFFLKSNSTIKNAYIKFNKIGMNTLIVTDYKNNYLGTLTSGDVRRAILKTKDLNTKITSIYNKKSTFLFNTEYHDSDVKKIFIGKKFELIPIINKSKKIIKILKLTDFLYNKKSNKIEKIKKTQVVIMAGGLGTRLLPFTEVLPKPLIPLNGKPILGHILESFEKFGITKFWLTVNYKSLLLRAYLNETKFKSRIKYYEEKIPLGTVGCLRNLYNKLDNDFILTNCDTIINTDLVEVFKFHQKNNYDITIISSLKKFNIPYGVCELDEKNKFSKINEKPNLNYLINTGFYILNKKILKLIPKSKFDMTDLIKIAEKKEKNIGVFPINDTSWIDIGNWQAYKKAVEQLE